MNSGYNFAKHSQVNTGQHSSLVVSRRANADLWQPSWNNTLTTFRPVPIKRPDGTLSPYRLSATANNFGEWIHAYVVFKGGTSSIVTFAIYDTERTAYGDEFNTYESPPFVLYNAINRAIEAGQGRPEWAGLTKGGFGKGAPLSAPKTFYTMQGFLIEHKSKAGPEGPRGLRPNHRLPIFMIGATGNNSAGAKLLNILNTRKPESIDDGNWDNMYVAGDPINPNTGMFFRFCETGGMLSASAAPVGYNQSAANTPAGGEQRKEYGYDVVVTDNVYNMTPTPPPEILQGLIDKTRPWGELIEITPVEEQIVHLARVFPPSAIEFGFADHPEWLTDDVRRILTARVTVGAAPQGAGHQPPMAAGYGIPAVAPVGVGYAPLNGYAAPAVAQPPVQHVQQPAPQVGSWGNVPYGQPGADTAVRPSGNQTVFNTDNAGGYGELPVFNSVPPVTTPPAAEQRPSRAAALDAARQFLPQ